VKKYIEGMQNIESMTIEANFYCTERMVWSI